MNVLHVVNGTAKGNTSVRVGTGLGNSGLVPAGGIVKWIFNAFRQLANGHAEARRSPRLAHVERVALAPRQYLHLVEADGVRLLVATSPDAAPVFLSLANSPAFPDTEQCFNLRSNDLHGYDQEQR